MPKNPSDSGWFSGKLEIPSSVVITGIWVFSAKLRSSSQAPDSSTPWPAMITWRRARDCRLAARARDQARGFLGRAHVRLERGLVARQIDAGRILGPLDLGQ